MNIYVGNLSYTAAEEDLKQAFSEYGEVTTVSIVKDKFTGNSRGFGFVEMPNDEEGQKAIDALNGQDVKGRALKVNEARPRETNGPRTGGSTGGGFRGRTGGNGGGNGGGSRGGFGGGGRY